MRRQGHEVKSRRRRGPAAWSIEDGENGGKEGANGGDDAEEDVGQHLEQALEGVRDAAADDQDPRAAGGDERGRDGAEDRVSEEPNSITPIMAATAMRPAMPRDADLAWGRLLAHGALRSCRAPTIAPNMAKAVFRAA